MAKFIGDYPTFYKFIDGYARNKTLALMRKYKSGVCACCGITNAEIQMAHKRGFERVDLVRKFFEASTLTKNDNEYTIDLDMFESMFVKFTSDVSNFHFLCGNCHPKYDRGIISEKDFNYKQESIKIPKINKI